MFAGAVSSLAQVAPEGEFKLHSGGFAAEEGGFVITATTGGALACTKELEPGQYVLTGDYKSENMPALSKFATDIVASDGRTSLSAYEFTCASPEWSPLVLYATVPAKGKVLLRFGNWQKANGAESKVHVRNLQIKPQVWTDGMNLLDHELKGGVMDYLPPNWYWKPGKSKDVVPGASYSLLEDAVTTKRAIVLVIPSTEDEILLHGRSINMPPAGGLEMTFRARAEKPVKIIPRIVQSWSAQYTMNTFTLTSDWKDYTVKYQIQPDPKRQFFFTRFDVPPKQESKVEITDLKLIYHAPAGATTKPVAAAAEGK